MYDLISSPRRLQHYNEIENIFRNFFNEPFFSGITQNTNNLKVDIRDNSNEYVLEADLPNVSKENLNVSFEDNVLTISVEQDKQVKEEEENYIRRERYQQSISRKFAFDGIESDSIEARYENGVLIVTLPKKVIQNTNRKIEIQ
ncbi:molecular chaperone (small heat shock protein) [Desulfosporosinus acidiphilus SJ4]|uniref:Molecular chaperone (Small heat shock protein) n=1 Tax=Desulfosporosinus acidiphilus (strain DSM 22704 / JCM 16185 / SJ4) TaxID=646529 RepID=I4D6M2_DESAJ|nr:Hsp20/alpha crystallin family protein [Desulfosporosinus acidiphilus]AFM41446.1 molecular chaperone (small heat shock protein) [Desulfosporosinus acidiphilus SJ4]